MSDLSPSTKALLRAARGDGPSAAARAKIWTGVGVGGGSVAAAAGSAATKAAAFAGSAKLLVLGALLGSAVTVGVAAMLLHVGSPPALGPEPAVAIAPERNVGDIVPASRASAYAEPSERTGPAPRPHPGRSAPRRHHPTTGDDDDALTREAAILAQARGALVRGQPETALAAIRAARSLPVRALEPETLALEARALRAEGHFDEADAVEAKLRAKFPENGLAR